MNPLINNEKTSFKEVILTIAILLFAAYVIYNLYRVTENVFITAFCFIDLLVGINISLYFIFGSKDK